MPTTHRSLEKYWLLDAFIYISLWSMKLTLFKAMYSSLNLFGLQYIAQCITISVQVPKKEKKKDKIRIPTWQAHNFWARKVVYYCTSFPCVACVAYLINTKE